MNRGPSHVLPKSSCTETESHGPHCIIKVLSLPSLGTEPLEDKDHFSFTTVCSAPEVVPGASCVPHKCLTKEQISSYSCDFFWKLATYGDNLLESCSCLNVHGFPITFRIEDVYLHLLWVNTISRMYPVLINEPTFILLFFCSHWRFILQVAAYVYTRSSQSSFLCLFFPFSKSPFYQRNFFLSFSWQSFLDIITLTVFILNGTFFYVSVPYKTKDS